MHAGIAALQGRNGIYFAGAHVVPGMGLLEQARAAGDAAADGVVRCAAGGGFECGLFSSNRWGFWLLLRPPVPAHTTTR